MLLKVDRVLKYENAGTTWDHSQGNCYRCGKLTCHSAYLSEEGKFDFLCYNCYEAEENVSADVPYPIRVTFSKNLKNELGMGNHYFPAKPSRKFFEGLSQVPHKKERINFRAHEVYLTIERARKEGYIK